MTPLNRLRCSILRSLLKLADSYEDKHGHLLSTESRIKAAVARTKILAALAKAEGRSEPIAVIDLSDRGIDTREGAS